MKFDWRSLLVLSVFVAGLGLGACTNARDGGGMDSSGTAGSSSGSSDSGSNTGGATPPTM